MLAQSLRKQDISFEIFERDLDKNARFQGWAIAIHTYVISSNFDCRVDLTTWSQLC